MMTPSVYKIRNDIEILPLDTSSTSEKYLVTTGDNKRFEISERILNLINILDGKTNIEEAAEKYSYIIGKKTTPQQLEQVIEEYLNKNGILSNENSNKFNSKTKSAVLFKISLFSAGSISYLTRILKYLFVKKIMYVVVTMQLIFLFYFFFLFEKPSITLTSFSIGDLVIIYIIILLTTLFHELGHASACSYFGANHGYIGIGLYLYFPVFYADVTDAWRLSRRERVIVDLGGVYFQMMSLIFVFFLFIITNELIYIKAIYFLLFSMIGTLNPFLRFDGYWIVSDILGIPNLRKRSNITFTAILNNLLLRQQNKLLILPETESRTRIFVITYSIISNLFFLIFIYFIVKMFPELILFFTPLKFDDRT